MTDEVGFDVLPVTEWIKRAHDMVSALCKSKGEEGNREWIMRIPAQPNYDPDLVIGHALALAEREIDRLEAERQKAKAELETARNYGICAYCGTKTAKRMWAYKSPNDDLGSWMDDDICLPSLAERAEYTRSDLVEAERQKAKEELGVCEWSQDWDLECNLWHTNCDQEFTFEDGGPFDNSMKYCCYCGKKLIARPYVAPPEEVDET